MKYLKDSDVILLKKFCKYVKSFFRFVEYVKYGFFVLLVVFLICCCMVGFIIIVNTFLCYLDVAKSCDILRSVSI